MFRKLSFALVGLAFCLLVDAQQPMLGECPRWDLIGNFSVKDFAGLWFQQARYRNMWQASQRCVYLNLSDVDENNSVSVDGYKTSTITDKTKKYEGYAIVLGPGEFHLEFPTSQIPKTNSQIPNFTVLATDYTSYALVAECHKVLLTKEMKLWMFTRERNPKYEAIQACYDVMAKYEMPRRYLRNTDQSNCPPVAA